MSIAVLGGSFLLMEIPNLSISRLAFDISVLVPSSTWPKQFTGNLNQLASRSTRS